MTAGKVERKSLTVANITDKPVTVTLSVEQFSVADYTYDYIFTAPKEDWVKLESTQLELGPGKSRSVQYAVAVPKDATPGGHYFTLFASTSLDSGDTVSNVRAATVLYATVEGKLRRTSEILKESFPPVSFGGDMTFTMDVKNTGNTHFFTYASGQLHGWTAKPQGEEVTHLLLPGAPRLIGATIQAPILPGIYTATYGFRTDDGQTISRSKHVLYVPPWSLAIPLGITWIGVLLKKRSKAKQI
ncbi:MAG: exported protein of unknown function [Candidatus Saccharibacteria bacterium]|nr:exported protein of unknown function [Candidatus Saccharibacteria bacterium]